jgi:hypothetical protein
MEVLDEYRTAEMSVSLDRVPFVDINFEMSNLSPLSSKEISRINLINSSYSKIVFQ